MLGVRFSLHATAIVCTAVAFDLMFHGVGLRFVLQMAG
jgi:hypothetical protein